MPKINKLVSIILLATGWTVSVGSIVMLGYGTQATYTVDGFKTLLDLLILKKMKGCQMEHIRIL